MRVLITGGAGFLGSHIGAHAVRRGHAVLAVDSEWSALSPLYRCVSLDVGGPELADVLDEFRPELCVHCAGRASVPSSLIDPSGDFNAGPALTMRLIDGLRRHAPACRLLLASSAAVYGDPENLPVRETQPVAPVSPYGFHKLMSEELCRELCVVYGGRAASVRIFSAYGAGLRRQVIWDICEKTRAGGPIRLQGSSSASRDFIHADDVAAGMLLIGEEAPMQGERYNLASGHETTIGELAGGIIDALGIERAIEFDGVTPHGVPHRWQADISKVRALGFTPEVPLDQGIRGYVEWWRGLSGRP